MSKLPLIVYTLLWIMILSGLVYSQSDLASVSKKYEWIAVKVCGAENEEFNLYSNRILLIRKVAIQALSAASLENREGGVLPKPGCTQLLMAGNRSIHIWGMPHRIMDRIDPDHDIDEERWK